MVAAGEQLWRDRGERWLRALQQSLFEETSAGLGALKTKLHRNGQMVGRPPSIASGLRRSVLELSGLKAEQVETTSLELRLPRLRCQTALAHWRWRVALIIKGHQRVLTGVVQLGDWSACR